jgi:Rps23 Pro-64 3,4-dihydroxylase Tpa1-like proline 4-hydroxylase
LAFIGQSKKNMIWLNYVKDKIENVVIINQPFPHMVIDDFLPIDDAENFYKQIIDAKDAKEKYLMQNEANGVKKTFGDVVVSESQKQIAGVFGSDKIAKMLADKFNCKDVVYADPTFDHAGLTISPPNSFLRYHADFNFSDKLNRYRVLNAIFYANLNYSNKDGGCLHLLDHESGTVEAIIKPVFNRCAVFLTSKDTPHGVSRNSSDFTRISFNCYFYTDQPPNVDQTQPHRTIWKN